MKRAVLRYTGFAVVSSVLYFGIYTAYWTAYKNKADCYFRQGIGHGASLLFHQAVSDLPTTRLTLLDPDASAYYYLSILLAESKGEQLPSFECRWNEAVADAKSRYPDYLDFIRSVSSLTSLLSGKNQ